MENEKIGIMLTPQCILKQEAEELDIHVLPMPFYPELENCFMKTWIFPEQDFMRSCVKEQMFQLHSLPHRKLWKCGTKCFYLMIRSSTFR